MKKKKCNVFTLDTMETHTHTDTKMLQFNCFFLESHHDRTRMIHELDTYTIHAMKRDEYMNTNYAFDILHS